MQVSASGGVPEPLTTLENSESGHRWPDVLPGGKAVLFTPYSGNLETARIAVQSLETGERRMLVVGTHPRYAPTGHIVFARANSLWAVPFDSDRLEVTGEPTPVLEEVQVNLASGLANFALAGDGSLVYVPSGAQAYRRLVWVDRDGREEALAAEPRAYVYPRISPDGSQVALDVRDQENDIWIWDFARETLRRLTFAPEGDNFPTWTPGGRRLAFGSFRDGRTSNLFWKAADGTGTVERLTESENNQFPQAFSPDGKQLVYWELHPQRGSDLGVRSLDGDGSLAPLLVTEFNEVNAEISPGGRWLAYRSDALGQYEIYVRPFPNVDEGRFQISRAGGTEPLWARDGSELFYLDRGRQLMAVSVRLDPGFDFGNPGVVLEESSPAFPGAGGRTYDVSPDGERFLMIKEGGSGDETPPAEPIVVLNWFEELKRLVPTN